MRWPIPVLTVSRKIAFTRSRSLGWISLNESVPVRISSFLKTARKEGLL